MTNKPNIPVISITFPSVLLEEVDGWAERLEISRSEFLRHAVHYYIAYFLKRKRFIDEIEE